ncbi:MAG: D-alanyl-D-alanine carboxypeptidase/D-alanyl-D-alanine-endopeptidase [Pseudomonadota bacterium]
MDRTITRRAALGGLLSGLAAPALATAPLSSLRPRPRPGSLPAPSAAELISRAKLGGVTAFYAARADGTLLEAYNGDLTLPPASVAKSVTALYAMDTLGDAYRFATVLLGTGPIEGGILKGDLILKGTGDPIFDTDALGGLAGQLRDAGVTAIEGGFFVDDRSLPNVAEIDPGQPTQAGYNPSVSGLNLNYNRVHFEWKRAGDSYDLTMDARARKYQPKVRMARMRAVVDPWPIYTHNVSGSGEDWTVARPALGNGGARWLPVRQPALYAGDVFRTLAASMGISLPNAQPEIAELRGTVLASHVSPKCRGLCGGMLKYSTNLTAEVLGLRASQARGAAPETLLGSAAAMNAWAAKRYGAHMALVDHSGLGDRSRVSCASLVQMQVQQADFAPVLKSIQAKNQKGEVLPEARYSIRAKTGTLNFVNSLSGYLFAPDAEPLVFAIISADLTRRAAIPPRDRDRPEGSRSYARRARLLQQGLLARWAALSASDV